MEILIVQIFEFKKSLLVYLAPVLFTQNVIRPIQWSLIGVILKKRDYITESPIIRRQWIVGFFNDSK